MLPFKEKSIVLPRSRSAFSTREPLSFSLNFLRLLSSFEFSDILLLIGVYLGWLILFWLSDSSRSFWVLVVALSIEDNVDG